MKSQGIIKLLPNPSSGKIGWPWTGETNTSKYLDDIVYPKISVVTISYNQAKYLEDAILSVLNQNYPNLEYFVIDGGSIDGSVEIIKKYSDRLTYWCSEKDNGPASGLNKGFAKATGKIFYYLNSDDVLLPNIFLKVISYMNQYPKFDVYYGHGYATKGTLNEKYPFYSFKWNLNFFRLGRISIFQQSTFIRFSAFNLTNGFNENNTTLWDAELLVDLDIIGAKFKRFNFHTAIFRLHESSISGNPLPNTKYIKEFKLVKDKIDSLISFKSYPILAIKFYQFLTDPIVVISRLKVKFISD